MKTKTKIKLGRPARKQTVLLRRWIGAVAAVLTLSLPLSCAMAVTLGLTMASTVVAIAAPPADAVRWLGTYVGPQQEIPVYMWPTRDACLAEDGEWNSTEDVCFKRASNRVVIRWNEEMQSIELDIATVGPNLHSCTFEEKAVFEVDAGKLISLISKNQTEFGECTVRVLMKNNDSVSVHSEGGCHYYCGMNADLDVPVALRVE